MDIEESHPISNKDYSNGNIEMCVECEDQPADGICDNCEDRFCVVCFGSLHQKGRRKEHKLILENKEKINGEKSERIIKKEDDNNKKEKEKKNNLDSSSSNISSSSMITVSTTKKDTEYYLKRSKYIPLRLSEEERNYLKLILSSLDVSEYTDKVDIYGFGNKAKRIYIQLREMCSILSGLVIANDYMKGQKLLKDKTFKDNQRFFRKVFEIGRRYKIMNPEKMRTDYGKLLYMLQDSTSQHVQEYLNFSCIRKIKTVYEFLQKRDSLDIFNDEYFVTAVSEVSTENKSRDIIEREIKNKEKALNHISKKYSNDKITEEEIKLCLYSISDSNSYLKSNRDPCDRMIYYLKKYFDPNKIESKEFSLAISIGKGGARLTHSHEKQYYYVLQSLTLWRYILDDMFKLWYLAEEDLLDERNRYRLCDTGQGLNRLQSCPRIANSISKILRKVQKEVNGWVGSSVVHLGDSNVPNAFMFIDKYNQVPRILNPIITCLDRIDDLTKDDELNQYIQSMGGSERVKKIILTDFFKHGFDGSGADNYFDAGSCIDGRLTSAWNWCSKIEKKKYFHIFLLTGFIGFDGEF